MSEGQRLFELLSDDNKRRALQGTLPSGLFTPEQMQQLDDWIQSSGTTVESYFTEVETMSNREREVRETLARIGLQYDENASVEQNAQRAADAVVESVVTGQPLPSGDAVSPAPTPEPRDLGQPTAYASPEVWKEYQPATVTPEDSTSITPSRLGELIAKGFAQLGLNPDGTPIDTSGTAGGDGTLGGGGGGTTGGGGGVVATAAADMSEVQRLLIERFGGITFFLDKYNQQLQVGVTADGSPVPTDDPRATRVMNVVDMMVEYGIVDPNQVLKVVQQTTWYQTTDNAMRRHDALMANMTDLEKKEYFDPVLEQLKDEAVFLGVSLTDELAMQMANDILYLGEADDIDFIRQTLVTQGSYDLSVVQGSSFAAITDSLVSLSKSYYTPIGTADAASLAQDIYFGNKTPEGVEQMFKEQAEAAFPLLKNALAAGITPEQYFAPYKYELERILGRPNIDIYEEFPEIVSHIGENGEMRPMTLNEVRRFARGLPEWQESSQGIDAAYALTFAIGEVFGEVA